MNHDPGSTSELKRNYSSIDHRTAIMKFTPNDTEIRQADRQTDRHTGRQTYRQTDGEEGQQREKEQRR